ADHGAFKDRDTMRPEYDFRGAIRGATAARYAEGTNKEGKMANKGRAMFMVLVDLKDERYEEEFNAWYNSEHLPELLGLPGVLDGARYMAVKGGPKYLAMYELESVEVMKTPEFTGRSV